MFLHLCQFHRARHGWPAQFNSIFSPSVGVSIGLANQSSNLVRRQEFIASFRRYSAASSLAPRSSSSSSLCSAVVVHVHRNIRRRRRRRRRISTASLIGCNTRMVEEVIGLIDTATKTDVPRGTFLRLVDFRRLSESAWPTSPSAIVRQLNEADLESLSANNTARQ